VILGTAWTPLQPLLVNLSVIIGFDLVMIVIGTYAFTKMK
jgi:hypothetical protein